MIIEVIYQDEKVIKRFPFSSCFQNFCTMTVVVIIAIPPKFLVLWLWIPGRSIIPVPCGWLGTKKLLMEAPHLCHGKWQCSRWSLSRPESVCDYNRTNGLSCWLVIGRQHKWEKNLCCFKTLKFGGYLWLQYIMAYF